MASHADSHRHRAASDYLVYLVECVKQVHAVQSILAYGRIVERGRPLRPEHLHSGTEVGRTAGGCLYHSARAIFKPKDGNAKILGLHIMFESLYACILNLGDWPCQPTQVVDGVDRLVG